MSRRALVSLPILMPIVVALVASVAASASEEVTANTGTARIAFAAREWLDVGLDVNGVHVDRIKLHEPGALKGLFTKHDEANRGKIVVTNRTDRTVSPALAVAVFDGEGRLLAAANTGARLRTVKPGETAELDIHFGGVFRYIGNGQYIYLSLEY